MADVGEQIRLNGGQRVAVGVSVALGLGLAAYGVAGSYQTVSGLAARRAVPLAPTGRWTASSPTGTRVKPTHSAAPAKSPRSSAPVTHHRSG
jgi:hypothetical protein